MSQTLFQIGDDLEALAALLEECEGDISRAGEMEAAVTAWIEELERDQGQKLDGYRHLLRKWESEIAVAKAMQEQYAAEARTRENRVRYMKDRIKQFMERTGQKKIATPQLGELRIQANGGKLPIVPEGWAGIDPKSIPVGFRKEVVDTEAVRAALEAGSKLEFAALGERGTHLRLK